MKYFWKDLVVEMPATFKGKILDLVLVENHNECIPFITEENGNIKITIGRMVQEKY